METPGLQQQLFATLKENLSPHLSLADELSKLLAISVDSIYRRIRGEISLNLVELEKICDHFHLSLDQLVRSGTQSVLFDAPGLSNVPGAFSEYMKAVLAQFHYFNTFRKREIRYLCKDSPIWYVYLFPEMAAFKTFFWSRTINNQPELRHEKFSLEKHLFDDCFMIGQQILREHNKIDSVELWNPESIHSIINQVAYYRDGGNFKTTHDFEAVIDSVHRWIDHLQSQAERGVKFLPGDTGTTGASIRFYINELILGNNTMVIQLDEKRISMITYSVFHYLLTRDDRFTDKVTDSFNSLLSRSTLISNTGEKERNWFFNALREKVNGLRK